MILVMEITLAGYLNFLSPAFLNHRYAYCSKLRHISSSFYLSLDIFSHLGIVSAKGLKRLCAQYPRCL